MKKMTPEVREALETAALMSSVQSYSRNTVLMIMNHLKAVEWEAEAQVKINRQLSEKNDRLEKELRFEGRKVAVPPKVAKSLEYYRNNSTEIQTILQTIADDRLIGPNATTLRNFSKENFDKLLAAMINGYAVEETTESQIEDKLASLFAKLNVQCSIPVDQLAKQLTLAVRESLARSTESTI